MKHTPTVGTVLSIAPASGIVRVELDGERWTLPLIGWCVVVTWVSDPDEGDERDQYETHLDAVVLLEGRYPVPLSQYERDDLDGAGRVTVEATG